MWSSLVYSTSLCSWLYSGAKNCVALILVIDHLYNFNFALKVDFSSWQVTG